MDFRLIEPTAAHATDIAAIWETGWHEAHADIVPSDLRALRTTETFRSRALENLADTRAAIIGDTVAGFCMVKDSELYQMYVTGKARGTGIAQALIRDAEDRIAGSGFASAWLACAIGNDRAARFYEKSGWSNAGEHVVHLDTQDGPFPLTIWRFEKAFGAKPPS